MIMKTEAVEWIAVEDRLPESNRNCWITIDLGTDDNRVSVDKGFYSRLTGSWYHTKNNVKVYPSEGIVIAWANRTNENE